MVYNPIHMSIHIYIFKIIFYFYNSSAILLQEAKEPITINHHKIPDYPC